MAALLTGFIALMLLVAGCRGEPRMRFYPKWTEQMNLHEVWEAAGTSLEFDSISCDAMGRTAAVPFGVLPDFEWTEADFKMFTVIVRGRLPVDHFLDVRAVYFDGTGVRRTARIEPVQIFPRGSGSSPWTADSDWMEGEGDLHAFKVTLLSQHGDAQTVILPKVSPGRYYVYLVRNGRRLCGSILTIEE